ncbi:hypothetical protein BCR35DRAFT_313564 [Leucosporidium creatinivorum]|uniref:MYND-type domain-containing protein n=1 Tax=Leucosporidium creatinivorum TaxID=106004 RepID=A0A1Y2FN92_9BASI|nr:hypothetical protein BCR35DRAFT_313564 [Leucosporidium creatinivorum]
MASAPASSSPPTESATEPPSTGNRLTSLDPSKKYTLIFLVSVGTTLLLTGASGGRLLKRAKKVTAEPTSVAHQPAVKPKARTQEPLPIPRAPLSPFTSPALDSYALSADPTSLQPRRQRSLLRSFRLIEQTTGQARPNQTAYFLPNSTLLSRSNAFAEALDKQDRLHKDGEEQPEAPDDGFNPAIYAAKAFGIATALTVGTFAAGVWGVMRWLEVDDSFFASFIAAPLSLTRRSATAFASEAGPALPAFGCWRCSSAALDSLSLALSHRLPSSLPRPSVPSWALPTSSPSDITTPGPEEDSAEHKEGVAYWLGVKETLDREAEERVLERRKSVSRCTRSPLEEAGSPRSLLALPPRLARSKLDLAMNDITLKECVVCGVATDQRCSRCKQVRFCSAEHQKLLWPAHKHLCGKSTFTPPPLTEGEVNDASM